MYVGYEVSKDKYSNFKNIRLNGKRITKNRNGKMLLNCPKIEMGRC